MSILKEAKKRVSAGTETKLAAANRKTVTKSKTDSSTMP